MDRKSAALAALLVFAACLPAAAQSTTVAWKRCLNERDELPPTRVIRGCTALIMNNEAPRTLRAVAYNNRGNVYFQTNDYPRAVADYDEAVKLGGANPNFVLNRCMAYLRLRNADKGW